MPIDMINDKPGPELDAKIAVELFDMAMWEEIRGEYKFVIFQRQEWTPKKGREEKYRRIKADEIDHMIHIVAHLPDYSRDWNGMQLVVEEMQRRGFRYILFYSEKGHWAQFEKWSSNHYELLGYGQCVSESLPLAVALAALKALEDSQS